MSARAWLSKALVFVSVFHLACHFWHLFGENLYSQEFMPVGEIV
jgi:hypothetical protein